MPSGKICCLSNSVGLDPAGWYHATIHSTSTDAATSVATVRFSLAIKNVFALNAWRNLSWGELSPMHGRRIHISATSDDLRYAWHEHVDESSLGASERVFSVQFALPEPAMRVRLLFNFGVLAENVDLCVDETASHIDPGPGGQELVVEGHVTSAVLPLGTSSGRGGPSTPLSPATPPLFGGSAEALGWEKTLSSLPLSGNDSDEIRQHAAIGPALTAACAAPSNGTTSGGRAPAGCWSARLAIGDFWPALSALRHSLAQSGGHEDGLTLLPAASSTSSTPSSSAADRSPHLIAPACVGFNVYVRRDTAGGAAANGVFAPYLTMAAHGIIARLGMPSPSYLPWYALPVLPPLVCPPLPTSLGMPSPSHLPWYALRLPSPSHRPW